jgi:hypothetical protein
MGLARVLDIPNLNTPQVQRVTALEEHALASSLQEKHFKSNSQTPLSGEVFRTLYAMDENALQSIETLVAKGYDCSGIYSIAGRMPSLSRDQRAEIELQERIGEITDLMGRAEDVLRDEATASWIKSVASSIGQPNIKINPASLNLYISLLQQKEAIDQAQTYAASFPGKIGLELKDVVIIRQSDGVLTIQQDDAALLAVLKQKQDKTPLEPAEQLYLHEEIRRLSDLLSSNETTKKTTLNLVEQGSKFIEFFTTVETNSEEPSAEILEQSLEFLTSEARATVQRSGAELLSIIPAKKEIITSLSRQAQDGKEWAQEMLWKIQAEASDTEISWLALEALVSSPQQSVNSQILQRCLDIVNSDTSAAPPQLQVKAAYILQSQGELTTDTDASRVEQLNGKIQFLSPEGQIDFALQTSQEILTQLDLNARTLPFIKIAALRLTGEYASSDAFATQSPEQLQQAIKAYVESHLAILEQENTESPYLPTVGLEVQGMQTWNIPTVTTPSSSGKREFLEVSRETDDYHKLIDYAGLTPSDDLFYEFSFPPSLTADLQSLTFAEIQKAGFIGTAEGMSLHINLGGIRSNEFVVFDIDPTNKNTEPFILQTIILGTGDIAQGVDIRKVVTYNSSWEVKGAVKERQKTDDALQSISTFESKSELRLFTINDPEKVSQTVQSTQAVASMAMAHQIAPENRDPVQAELATMWENFVQEANGIYKSVGFDIMQPWTREKYGEFGDLLRHDEVTRKGYYDQSKLTNGILQQQMQQHIQSYASQIATKF